jgi:hypothetical protein
MVTQEILQQLFNYDSESGNFYWKIKRRGVKSLTNPTGSKHSEGYVVIGVNGKIYFAHRLAWIYMYGEIPEKHDIDHIDGDRSNNRIKNLRIATRWQNLSNSNHSNGKSKYRGVWFSKVSMKWQSMIRVNKERYYLGLFLTQEEARDAYLKKSKELRGEFSK